MNVRKREELEARQAVDIARLAKEGAGSLFFTVLILAVAVFILAASIMFHTSWDVSRTSSNSLSPQTLQVLERLDGPVEIYPLVPKQNEIVRESYWSLLKLYRDRSRFIKVEFIDPIEQPGRLAEIGADVQGENLNEGVTFIKRTTVRNGVPVEWKQTFGGREEEDVTNAILDVGRTRERVVGFLRGYGERDPESKASGAIAGARNDLLREYYRVTDVDLERSIPDRVTVLVLADPRQRIPDEHLEALHLWLEKGGRLLALQDPDRDTGVNNLLQRWGLRVSGRMILDPKENFNRSPSFVKVNRYSKHPVVKDFGKQFPTAFAGVSTVSQFETGEGKLFHDDLAFTSSLSFVLNEDGSRDPGPFAVAAASWRRTEDGNRENEARLIVVGDADFISNAYLPQSANRNFFLNMIAWLSREEELISVRRDPMQGQTIELTPRDGVITFWAILAAPILVLLVGVVVMFRRRGR